MPKLYYSAEQLKKELEAIAGGVDEESAEILRYAGQRLVDLKVTAENWKQLYEDSF